MSSSDSLVAMSMYWPSHRATHVSSYSRISRRTFASLNPSSVRRWSAIRDEAEQHVAGVDRLGDAVERPERRPVAALAVAVLDVVVDEAEVVAELDGGGARQRAPCGRRRSRRRRGGRGAAGSACPTARRRGRARGGSGPSRRRRAVDGSRSSTTRRISRLGVGDERLEVEVARDGGHRGQCSRIGANMRARSSLLAG